MVNNTVRRHFFLVGVALEPLDSNDSPDMSKNSLEKGCWSIQLFIKIYII